MGRQADPGTANSEIFFMRDTSRRLDHDYAVWGRVISGLDVVRAIAVGEPPAHPDKMIRVRIMADLVAADRPKIEILSPSSPLFRAKLDELKTREGANFSICDMPISTRPASNDGT
jgi:peptidylprolyl isomerase